MYTDDNVKENVEALLELCIPVKLRKALTNVLKEYNNFMHNQDEFVCLLKQVEWLPARGEIQDAMLREKYLSQQSLELSLIGESQASDDVVEYS